MSFGSTSDNINSGGLWNPSLKPESNQPSGVDPSFNLDFGPLYPPDILENFDFDSFLGHPNVILLDNIPKTSTPGVENPC